jgi:hypothetical protein
MVGLEIKDGSCIIDGYRWILLLRAEAKFLVPNWGDIVEYEHRVVVTALQAT